MVEVRQALVVAGGQGTRLRPLTDDVSKPLLPLGGTPFLEGVIQRLATVGVTRVYLVVGAETEAFEVLIAPAARLGVDVRLVPEPEPLDTAGGVRLALEDVDEPAYVLNGDVLTDLDLLALSAHHLATGAAATISLVHVDDTSSYGVCVRSGTRIVDFVEKPAPGSLPGQRGVNAGTYILSPGVLNDFSPGPLSFERDVFPTIVRRGKRVEGFAWDGVWADLGTPRRYRHGHQLVLDGAMPWPPVEAVPERDRGIRTSPAARLSDDAELVGPVLIGPEAIIDGGARVGPYVTMGAGSRIGMGARVHDTVLLDGAAIGPGVDAQALIAGSGAVVAEGARLGRGVVLGAHTRVDPGERMADEERRPSE